MTVEPKPIQHQDIAAKKFLWSGIAWLLIATTFGGLFVSLKMHMPNLFGTAGFVVTTRLRPIHVNGVAFGWLSMAYIAAIFYVTPRLLGTKLWSEALGRFTCWLWNIVVILAVITLAMGLTQAREYAELIMPLDILIALAVVLVNVNFWMTFKNRTEKRLYVTFWYIAASLIWLPIVYIIGNWPGIHGINDANINWFYGHNILGLWFTTVAVGFMYYVIPLESRNPLYSHLLSLIGFWMISFVYVWTGAHHLVYGPIPRWLYLVAAGFSIMLIIPVTTVVVNFWVTMRGKAGLGKSVRNSLVLLFATFGTIHYLITCYQGPAQATPWLSRIVKFTNWVPAHAHLALLGTFSFFVFSFVYFWLPRMTGRPIYSMRLAYAHFWLTLVGFYIFFMALTGAGLVQALTWSSGVPFLESVLNLFHPFVTRTVGGVIMALAQWIFAYNVWQTVRESEAARVAATEASAA